jgi:hypothetical protein
MELVEDVLAKLIEKNPGFSVKVVKARDRVGPEEKMKEHQKAYDGWHLIYLMEGEHYLFKIIDPPGGWADSERLRVVQYHADATGETESGTETEWDAFGDGHDPNEARDENAEKDLTLEERLERRDRQKKHSRIDSPDKLLALLEMLLEHPHTKNARGVAKHQAIRTARAPATPAVKTV